MFNSGYQDGLRGKFNPPSLLYYTAYVKGYRVGKMARDWELETQSKLPKAS